MTKICTNSGVPRIALTANGHAEVACSTSDIGTGTYTIMTQVAADMLGLPLESVTVKLGDSTLPQSPVEGGSWIAASVSRAIANAARLPAGPVAYNLACVYAFASASAAADRRLSERERCARADDLACRAIAELRRAHTAGLFDSRSNLDHLDHDRRLCPLRSRPDYKALRLDLAFPIDPFAARR